MIYRQFNAPNVEYHEIDRSQYDLASDNPAVGTITFATGFADKGDDYDPKYSKSLNDFIKTYGYPTNEAERYFYAAAKEVFLKGGRIITSKIPYDNDSKDKFAYTVYASDGVKKFSESELSELSALDESLKSYIELHSVDKDSLSSYLSVTGTPDRSGLMTLEQYDSLIVGKVKPRENSLFIVDIARNRYAKDPNLRDLSANQTDSYLGYLPVVVSPWNALYFQNLISAESNEVTAFDDKFRTSDFNVVSDIQTIPNVGYISSEVEPCANYETRNDLLFDYDDGEEDVVDSLRVLRSRIDSFASNVQHMDLRNESDVEYLRVNEIPGLETLSSDFAIQLAASESVSETLSKTAAKFFPTIRFYSEKHLDTTYLKQIGIVVFKMVSDPSNDGKVKFVPVESYVGSLNRKAKDPVTGKNIFIDNVVNEKSQTINVFSNFDFSGIQKVSRAGSFTNQTMATELEKASIVKIANQTATSLGFFVSQCSKFISKSVIEKSLDMILENCKNPNIVPFDILCDAGMSNIAQYMETMKLNTVYYEPEYDFNGDFAIRDADSTSVWRSVLNRFDEFAKNGRKDCIFVADAPRPFCLNGNEKIIRSTAPQNTIVNSLVPKIRFMLPPNSSYSAGYCNWFKCLDDVTGDYFWCPPSIKAVGVYLYTDRYANVWDAPAGENRGKIEDAYDIAFNPTVEEAQNFYEQQWNYAVSYPLNGIVLEGQKTFQIDKTALDRVNVRRLCNGIKKGIREIARWFKYEGITPLVLTRFRDQIETFLQKIQANYGISEYYIKLDEENNTPETIDRNEIHAAIAIRPVKTAEFIIINSIVVNQSANLEEVTNSVLA